MILNQFHAVLPFGNASPQLHTRSNLLGDFDAVYQFDGDFIRKQITRVLTLNHVKQGVPMYMQFQPVRYDDGFVFEVLPDQGTPEFAQENVNESKPWIPSHYTVNHATPKITFASSGSGEFEVTWAIYVKLYGSQSREVQLQAETAGLAETVELDYEVERSLWEDGLGLDIAAQRERINAWKERMRKRIANARAKSPATVTSKELHAGSGVIRARGTLSVKSNGKGYAFSNQLSLDTKSIKIDTHSGDLKRIESFLGAQRLLANVFRNDAVVQQVQIGPTLVFGGTYRGREDLANHSPQLFNQRKWHREPGGAEYWNIGIHAGTVGNGQIAHIVPFINQAEFGYVLSEKLLEDVLLRIWETERKTTFNKPVRVAGPYTGKDRGTGKSVTLQATIDVSIENWNRAEIAPTRHSKTQDAIRLSGLMGLQFIAIKDTRKSPAEDVPLPSEMKKKGTTQFSSEVLVFGQEKVPSLFIAKVLHKLVKDMTTPLFEPISDNRYAFRVADGKLSAPGNLLLVTGNL